MTQEATFDLAALIQSIRGRWAKSERAMPEERWFSSALELDAAEVRDGLAVLVFHDAYGQRFGWRWRWPGEPSTEAADPDWADLLEADLMDDLINGGWTATDPDGVRWLLPEVEVRAAPGLA